MGPMAHAIPADTLSDTATEPVMLWGISLLESTRRNILGDTLYPKYEQARHAIMRLVKLATC